MISCCSSEEGGGGGLYAGGGGALGCAFGSDADALASASRAAMVLGPAPSPCNCSTVRSSSDSESFTLARKPATSLSGIFIFTEDRTKDFTCSTLRVCSANAPKQTTSAAKAT